VPELPDLEIYCRNLHARLAGREVGDVRVGRTRRRNFTNAQIEQALDGDTLEAVHRSGKQSHFLFRSGHCLAVHLMLTGRFDLTDNPSAIRFLRLGLGFADGERFVPEEKSKYGDKLGLKDGDRLDPGEKPKDGDRYENRDGNKSALAGGEWLVVSDPHSWATFTLDPPADPTPDALDAACDVTYLRDRLREQKERCLKEFLVDQRLVRGIGNAYSDEILWACRIAPRSRCDRLPEGKVGELHAAIRSVLEDAIAQLGRLDPDAIHGERRDFLQVHRPDRTHSPTGFAIRCERIGTRKTYSTDEQVEYR